MSKIVLRTHGGLGNQLFQVYFALCCKFEYQYQKIVIIHDNRYRHKFALDEKLREWGQKASLVDYFVSAMRLPKIIKKIGRVHRETLEIGRTRFMDGYFQDHSDYASFSTTSLSAALSVLRTVLGVEGDGHTEAPCLEHLRLGDFFENNSAEEFAARSILEKIKKDSHIVTNNESLVMAICAEGNLSAKLTLVTTKDMPAAELLHLMGRYAEIRSNDSTLALWAALLYRRNLHLENTRLQKFFALRSQL